MLTELKKTTHIIVEDMNTVPNEQVLADAINSGHDHNVERCFAERGDALSAAIGFVPAVTDTDKVCPPIDQFSVSYYVWSVEMHFTRACAFEPTRPLRSIVAVVNDKCKQLAEAVIDDLQLVIPRDKATEVTKQVAEKLLELFEDGEFSIGD